MRSEDGPAVVVARGHPHITAAHHKSLEITRDDDLTERGTCIVGVGAEWDDATLLARRGRQRVTLRVGEVTAELETSVSPSFLGGSSLVLRRGPDLAERTFGHDSTAAAADLDRALVAALRQPGATLRVELEPVPSAAPAPGVLFVVALPIGNHDDMTPRARRVLLAADVVLAEDTRRYRSLARDLGLPAGDVRSHHLGNEGALTGAVVDLLRDGARVALVSDAGTPVISDPGFPLVRRAREQGVTVRPVPGASAPVVALSAAGIPADAFTFVGFLPRRGAARRTLLADMGRRAGALVAFEAPHRLMATLADLAELLPGRELCVARELTKIHEEITSTRTERAADELREVAPRGEYTLVIGPPPVVPATTGSDDEAVVRLVRHLGEAVPTRTLADALAAATGIPRRQAYRQVLALRDGEDEGGATGDGSAQGDAVDPAGPER